MTSSEDFSVPACTQRKPRAASVKRGAVPQMGSCSPTAPKPLQRKLLFSPALLLLAGVGKQSERLAVIFKAARSQQRGDLCPRVLSRLCASEETNPLAAGFVGSPVNCCYCQFTACPSCWLDSE